MMKTVLFIILSIVFGIGILGLVMEVWIFFEKLSKCLDKYLSDEK